MMILGNIGDIVHLRQVSSEEGKVKQGFGSGYSGRIRFLKSQDPYTFMMIMGNKGDIVHRGQVSSEKVSRGSDPGVLVGSGF